MLSAPSRSQASHGSDPCRPAVDEGLRIAAHELLPSSAYAAVRRLHCEVAEAMRQGQGGPSRIMARLYELLGGVLPNADFPVEPEAVNCVKVARFLLDKALRRAAGGCPLMIVCDAQATPADCASLLLIRACGRIILANASG